MACKPLGEHPCSSPLESSSVSSRAALLALVLKLQHRSGIGEAARRRDELVADAKREADNLRREAEIEAREQAMRFKADAEQALLERRGQIAKLEERVLARQDELEGKLTESAASRAWPTASQHQGLQQQLKEAKDEELHELEEVSGLTVNEEGGARSSEQLIRHDLARRVRQLDEEAQIDAKRKARNLVADALQRVAASHAAETTSSVVELPSDDMKGRIIGREGRNIRTLEHLTGVDIIIDDTPQAVVLSSFDGIRREIAKPTPPPIEDGASNRPGSRRCTTSRRPRSMTTSAWPESRLSSRRTAATSIPSFVKLLGRFHYRTSYGQNVPSTRRGRPPGRDHGPRARGELAHDKRAAMLHDLGKALTHEVEGSHAQISADYASRYGEAEAVVHAIAAHHYEVQPQTVEAVLLIAADAISGSRPGPGATRSRTTSSGSRPWRRSPRARTASRRSTRFRPAGRSA